MSDNILSQAGYDQEEAYIKQKETTIRLERDKLRAELEKTQQKELHWMRCPKCGSKMEERDMESIKIDYCPSCEGMFFDKGEFEIAAKSLESHTMFDKISSFLKW